MFDPQKHRAEYKPVIISKLSAARRQLNCALEMFFNDKDAVAVHTLSVAAHQIIHDIHDKTFPNKPLFFNTPAINDENRRAFIGIFKEAANFFKHADKDANPGSTIEFSPFLTQIFFSYAIFGLSSLGESNTDIENAYKVWFAINHPEMANPDFVKIMREKMPAKYLNYARQTSKRDFLQLILEAQIKNKIG